MSISKGAVDFFTLSEPEMTKDEIISSIHAHEGTEDSAMEEYFRKIFNRAMCLKCGEFISPNAIICPECKSRPKFTLSEMRCCECSSSIIQTKWSEDSSGKTVCLHYCGSCGSDYKLITTYDTRKMSDAKKIIFERFLFIFNKSISEIYVNYNKYGFKLWPFCISRDKENTRLISETINNFPLNKENTKNKLQYEEIDLLENIIINNHIKNFLKWNLKFSSKNSSSKLHFHFKYNMENLLSKTIFGVASPEKYFRL